MNFCAIPKILAAASLFCGSLSIAAAVPAKAEQAATKPFAKIIATIQNGGGCCNIVIDPKTNAAYAAGAGKDHNQIAVIDGQSNQITDLISGGEGGGPLWFDDRQDLLYVASNTGPTFVVDPKTNAVVRTINTTEPNRKFVDWVAANSATGKLYTAFDGNIDGNTIRYVTVWDLKTGAPIGRITGDYTNSGTINGKTNRLYVTDEYSAQLIVVDGVTTAVLARIPVGQGYFPDECYLLNNGTNAGCITQTSFTIDLDVSEKTNRVYVANFRDGTLYVIDGKTNQVISGPIAVGAGVEALALDDVHDVLYMLNIATAAVSAFDVKAMRPLGAPIVVGTPPSQPGCFFKVNEFSNCPSFGTAPSFLAVNPSNNKIYLGGAGADTEDVIVLQRE